MSGYDTRLYVAMLDQLALFESKVIDLKHLISGLESLLCALEGADVKWKSSFQKQWGVLEDVYADMLDRGSNDLNGAHRLLVEAAVRNLKFTVESALHLKS